jgi:hypothetical protein
VVALLQAERHERPGAPLDRLPELAVGVAQVPVGVDQGFVVRAALVDEVQQAADGQAVDILRAHVFLLFAVPTDCPQSSNQEDPRKRAKARSCLALTAEVAPRRR